MLDIIISFFGSLTTVAWILLLGGLLGIILEIFTPGFGFFGALGSISVMVSIFLTANSIIEFLVMFILFAMFIGFVIVIVVHLAKKGKLGKGIILENSVSEKGINKEDMQFFVGKIAETLTTLRPSGSISIDGVKLDAVADGGFIEKGKKVEVIRVDGIRIVVKERK